MQNQHYFLRGTGKFYISITGTTHYKSNIIYICNGTTNKTPDKMYLAEIALESDNQADKNAVKISIKDRTVGHLSREDAKFFRNVLSQHGIHDTIFNCYAKITGGWHSEDGFIGNFGVNIDLPEDFINYEQPPPGDYITFNTKFNLGHIDKLELKECNQNQTVNFWIKPQTKNQIYVYRTGSCGGAGYIGKVPLSHCRLINNHLENNLPIHAYILRSRAKTEVLCTLFSKKYIQNNFINEIAKKYTPRGGFSFTLDVSKNNNLKIGEDIYLKNTEINFYVENIINFNMAFINSNGAEIGSKKYPDQKTIKLLRALHNGHQPRLTVSNIENANTPPEYRIFTKYCISVTFNRPKS